MDNDRRQAGGRNPVEGVGQSIEGDNDDDSRDNTSSGSAHARLGLESRSREGTGGRVGTEARANSVGNTDSDELLVRVDLIAVETAKR